MYKWMIASVFLLMGMSGCQWHTLTINTPDAIYLGPYPLEAIGEEADSIGAIKGIYVYDERPAVTIQRRSGFFRFGGSESFERTIEQELDDQLGTHPARFVSDTEITIYTRTGFSAPQILMSLLFSDTYLDFGLKETFIIHGTARQLQGFEEYREEGLYE